MPPERAARELEQAADQRRLALDYRGMARALSLAGEAVLRQGRAADAAVLFLRAGRSALLQGDAATGVPCSIAPTNSRGSRVQRMSGPKSNG